METRHTLPDGLAMGEVTLRVADLGRSVAFYENALGFRRLSGDGAAALGTTDDVPLLTLQETPGARPQPRHAAGLYHVAVLLPSRANLGRALARLLGAGVPLGQSDHRVSEALYLSDPDGNGLEIYRDRPRDQWVRVQGQVQMAVDPLDLRELLAEARCDPSETEGETLLPVGTRIGHVHLQVGDLAHAEHFYQDMIGLALTARFGDAATFLSAGGYHHHLGLNTWQSRGAAPAPHDAAGIASFTLTLPAAPDVAAVRARVDAAGLPARDVPGGFAVSDPTDTRLQIVSRTGFEKRP